MLAVAGSGGGQVGGGGAAGAVLKFQRKKTLLKRCWEKVTNKLPELKVPPSPPRERVFQGKKSDMCRVFEQKKLFKRHNLPVDRLCVLRRADLQQGGLVTGGQAEGVRTTHFPWFNFFKKIIYFFVLRHVGSYGILPRVFQLALCRRNDERRVVAAATASPAVAVVVAVAVIAVVVVAPPQLDRGRAGGGVGAEAGVLENVLKHEISIS